jgi:hypothetical protein
VNKNLSVYILFYSALVDSFLCRELRQNCLLFVSSFALSGRMLVADCSQGVALG